MTELPRELLAARPELGVPPTGGPLAPGRTTTQARTPPGTEGFAALDWKDGRLAGIEILDASTRLHHDLIDRAEINS
jgi:hypothetical protein